MPTFKTSENFSIHYEVHGPEHAERTIIFAHGNGNCLKDWHSLGYVDALSSKYRLILMDALGYGESEKPYDAAQYTTERRAADVIALLDHLDVAKADFFGGSVGGSLGFVLADEHLGRFSSFIIGSAHPYGIDEPIGYNVFSKEFTDLMKEKGMEGFILEMEEKYLGRRFREDVRAEYLKNDPEALAAANASVWPNRSASLAGIHVPVLLFAGEKDPVSQLQEKIGNAIRDAEIHILKEMDHCDAYWEGKQVADLVDAFLTKNLTCQSAKMGCK